MKKGASFIALLVLISFGFFAFNFFKQEELLIKPQLLGVGNIFSPVSLEKVVSDSLEGTKGTYALVIKNLKTSETYFFNENKIFEPGSLYKLWVMGTVYEKIQKEEIKEDEILSQKIDVLNRKFEIDEDEVELKEGGITLSVAAALNQMITISHNYAALLLSDRVKNSALKEFLDKYGFSNSDLGSPPKTTAQDITLFFEKLYVKQIINEEYSQRMIDLLKKQQLNDGLPKYLPEGVQVAHKTGEIGWFKHDGGIVFTPKGDYIIVVLSESESPVGAQERIAQLSKAVYDYFTK